MASLTAEERVFKAYGARNGIRVYWPVIVIVLASIAISEIRPEIYPHCIGEFADGYTKYDRQFRALVALPCSPFLIGGGVWNWVLLAAAWVPVPFLVRNILWAKRKRAYWEKVRRKERERRQRKRDEKVGK